MTTLAVALSPSAEAIRAALLPQAERSGDTVYPHHAQMLADSGIAPEVAAARGYRTVTQKAHLREWGFAPYQCRVPALLIPLWNVHGEQAGFELRPDDPRIRKNGEPVKYERPKGSRNMIDVPPTVRHLLAHRNDDDKFMPLLITEGAKKADAAASRGWLCLNIPGVSGWRGANSSGAITALDDWDYIATKFVGGAARQVALAFDSDILTKYAVHAALKRFRAFLKGRGADCRVIVLPSGPGDAKVGLDDWLAAGHDIAELRDLVQEDLPDIAQPRRIIVPPPPSTNGHNGKRELPKEPRRLTDLGNAERLVDAFGDTLRFVPVWGWVRWDGKRWQREDDAAVEAVAAQVVRNIYREAADCPDDNRRQEIVRHAVQSEGRARIAAMRELARGFLLMAHAEFDRDPWLLNVGNGTIDLRTGKLLPHDPARFISKLAPIEFDPDAACPLWLSFQDKITAGSADLQRFKQRYWGYSLTGSTVEQCFAIYYGSGQNGKSTEMDIMSELLGDYALSSSFSTFVERRPNHGGPSEDLARLDGARLVTAVESERGQRLAESVVKQVTGGDVINARFLNKNSFDFRPQFKMVLASNHKPEIRGTDYAIWRRVRLVPFKVTIPPEQADMNLKDKLRAEQSGILNWALAGCASWIRDGLGTAEEVTQATAAYRAEMDILGEFLGSCCTPDNGLAVAAGDLYAAYQQWCEASGEAPVKQRTFGSLLAERGFAKGKGTRGTRYWYGIGLVVPDDADGGEERPIYASQSAMTLGGDAPGGESPEPVEGPDGDEWGSV
ncbi:MAG: phage/plasmid primase, P4 family [Dehalococcoidia bacterium]